MSPPAKTYNLARCIHVGLRWFGGILPVANATRGAE
jgi:hypothetical protein